MNSRIDKRPCVLVDLESIAVEIGRERPRTALRFLDAAEKTFALLARFPQLGAQHPCLPESLRQIRCFPVKRFATFVVFYLVKDDGIEVIRVLHGARNMPAVFAAEEPNP